MAEAAIADTITETKSFSITTHGTMSGNETTIFLPNFPVVHEFNAVLTEVDIILDSTTAFDVGSSTATLKLGSTTLTSTSTSGAFDFTQQFTSPADLANFVSSTDFSLVLSTSGCVGDFSTLCATWTSDTDLTLEFTFTATPLPAALPLFATGLSGLGLLGWRRKRKALA